MTRTVQLKTMLNEAEAKQVASLFGGSVPDGEVLRAWILERATRASTDLCMMAELKFLRIFALNQLPTDKARELERYADSQKVAKAREELEATK